MSEKSSKATSFKALIIEPTGEGRVEQVPHDISVYQRLLGSGGKPAYVAPLNLPDGAILYMDDEAALKPEAQVNERGSALLMLVAGHPLAQLLRGPLMFLSSAGEDEGDVPDWVLEQARALTLIP